MSFLLPISLFLLRLIIAVIFYSSGKKKAQNPVDHSEGLGMSVQNTRILGIAELAAAFSIAFGILIELGAIIIIIIMLGAIHKKIYVWNTGFYADKGYGWHYDVLLMFGALVILATSGGVYKIF